MKTTLVTNRFGIYSRGFLYLLLAVLPVVQAGRAAGLSLETILFQAVLAGATTLRAFVDKSPAQVESIEHADVDMAVSSAPMNEKKETP